MGQDKEVKSRGEGGGEIVSKPSPFDSLPEDCISNIISFTSPRDACVAASVSRTFGSAVKSDLAWENFLPPEYASLVPRSRDFSSKKELYFSLCDDPVLIDDGKKSFWLEKANGKRCIMLSAVSLSITWGDNPHYWQSFPCSGSSFERVMVLIEVCWLEIRGRINTRLLSPRTRYSAHIVFYKEEYSYGFEGLAVEAGVGVVGQEASTRFICFDASENGQVIRRRRRRSIVKPERRKDGWMEIELGEFFNEGGLNGGEIEISVLETKLLHWKRGLVFLGIEIRPSEFF
uniref:F-box protein PP2-B10 n=1 Tax=Noccaea caerulescens TaxID=107243 RepID=A0A1J3K585_NOCCA